MNSYVAVVGTDKQHKWPSQESANSKLIIVLKTICVPLRASLSKGQKTQQIEKGKKYVFLHVRIITWQILTFTGVVGKFNDDHSTLFLILTNLPKHVFVRCASSLNSQFPKLFSYPIFFSPPKMPIPKTKDFTWGKTFNLWRRYSLRKDREKSESWDVTHQVAITVATILQ